MQNFKYKIYYDFINQFGSANSYVTRNFLSSNYDTSDVDDEAFLFMVFSLYSKPKVVVEKILAIKNIEEIEEECWLHVITMVHESGYSSNINWVIQRYEKLLCELPTVYAYLLLNNYKIAQSVEEKKADSIKKTMSGYRFKLRSAMIPYMTPDKYDKVHNTFFADIPKKYDAEYFNMLVCVCDINYYDDWKSNQKIHDRLVDGITKYFDKHTLYTMVDSVKPTELLTYSFLNYSECDAQTKMQRIETLMRILLELKYPDIKDIVLKYVSFVKKYSWKYDGVKTVEANILNDFGPQSKELHTLQDSIRWCWSDRRNRISAEYIDRIDLLEKLALKSN